MTEPGTQSSLISRIIAEPRPVIFLDTCSILDVVRVFFRQTLQPGIAESAVEVIDASSKPRKLWAVTSRVVFDEYRKNRPIVDGELLRNIDQIQASVIRFASFGRLSSPDRRVEILHWLNAEFRERIMTMLDRFVASLLLFEGSSECMATAHQRVLAGLAPATRSSEYKDCYIFEEFLEFLAGVEKAAHHRAHRAVHDLGDLAVAELLHVAEQHRHAEVLRQLQDIEDPADPAHPIGMPMGIKIYEAMFSYEPATKPINKDLANGPMAYDNEHLDDLVDMLDHRQDAQRDRQDEQHPTIDSP